MEEELKKLIKSAVLDAIEESGLTAEHSDSFPEIMSLEQASEFVHLSKDYIKNYKEQLEIPHRRKGRTYLFLKSELLEWVAERDEKKESKATFTAVKSKKNVMKIV